MSPRGGDTLQHLLEMRAGTRRPKRYKSLSDEFEKPIGIEALFGKGKDYFQTTKLISKEFFEKFRGLRLGGGGAGGDGGGLIAVAGVLGFDGEGLGGDVKRKNLTMKL